MFLTFPIFCFIKPYYNNNASSQFQLIQMPYKQKPTKQTHIQVILARTDEK